MTGPLSQEDAIYYKYVQKDQNLSCFEDGFLATDFSQNWIKRNWQEEFKEFFCFSHP